jgi:catechol 2,3-dioxygenase-like lactoylglutathione lyase family enzyme
MAAPKSARLSTASPVFVVEDVKRSVDYYRNALGFRVEFTHGEPPSYAGIERDNVTVHLQTARDSKRKAGQSAIYVFVTDVDALHRELRSRGAKIVNGPRDYPYGMRDFDVEDLDGNSLCFGMELKKQ